MKRNRQDVYEQWQWWGDGRHERILRRMVPTRMKLWADTVWADRAVLDVGCGGGFMVEALANAGAQVVGLDASKGAAEQGNNRLESIGFGRPIVYGSATDLPFDAAQFDHVICVDVLEHIPQWPIAVNEIARVLRPGGRFFFDTINRNIIARWLGVHLVESALINWVPPGTHDPKMFIKPAELNEALRNAGLNPEGTQGIGMVGVDRKLEPLFGRVPLRTIQYAGTASKPLG
ncbi:MAG: bifunctional 2-polyprenyl-6-hydroxyphenol methylase/3-demethylubiquinol 3-O-methyltransferase UbiG [Myxococcota bacterium]